ncbi:MAG: DUF2063 domain-containing protein [Boseongicola sp.]|nr:DNA-binding domain-containing protein [Boseongicola sp.]NNL19391.1 DUF2063 domain-containing protein [Boseongicola sp.]
MNVDQTTFRQALLDPDAPRPDGLADGQGREAGRRFDVYRNNVTVALGDALETAFPTVAKLVGAQNFKLLAAAYLRQHPPKSPLMMFYGEDMPAFLATFQPTSTIGYLPDIARLELAMRHSYHAADARAFDPAVLQSIPPEKLMASVVTLAPATRLIRSRWPIHAIWAFNNQPEAPKPIMASEDTLILRAELDPVPHLLPKGGGAFVEALLDGESLGTAIERATIENEAFDLSEMLALLITNNALTDLKD